MAGRKRSRVNPLHLLISILFLILIVGGAIFFAKTYEPPTTEEYIQRSDRYLEDLAWELGVEAQLQETMYWDWIDENNNLLPLTGNQFLIGTVNVNGIGKYGKIKSDSLEKINDKFFKPILATSDEFFADERFYADKRNSRVGVDNPLHETYRGFEKGPIKCLLRLTAQSDPFGYFFCGVVDEEEMELQQQFSSLFSTKYNPKKPSLFRVDLIKEPFARGNFSEAILGYVWIAKKENDEWKIIWKGNEIALCSEMERLEIPKSIYQNCAEE